MRIPHVALGLKYSPLFTGLLFLFITLLAMNTSRLRQALRIWVGDGGNDELRLASRAHGTSVEHGVLSAVLLVLLEWQRAPAWAVVTLGVVVVAARIADAAGMLLKEGKLTMAGVAGTYLSELVLSLWVVINGLRAL